MILPPALVNVFIALMAVTTSGSIIRMPTVIKKAIAIIPELRADGRSSGADVFFRVYDPVEEAAMCNAFAVSLAAFSACDFRAAVDDVS